MVKVLSSSEPVAEKPEKKVHSRRSFMSWLFADTESAPELVVKQPVRWFTAAAIIIGATIVMAVAFVFVVPYMVIRTALMVPG
jgi:hypothetical protein